MNPLLTVWVVAASLLAFLLCAVDKHHATKRTRRIRERTLLSCALLGGTGGLFAAMLILRHKVRKPAFLARLLLVVLVHLAGTAAWSLTRP